MMIIEDMVPALSLQELLFLNVALNTPFPCAVSLTEPRVVFRNMKPHYLFEISTNKGERGRFAKICGLHCLSPLS